MNPSTSETHTAGKQETRDVYPPFPAHVLERLGGYLGPGLRKQMAFRRKSNTEQAADTRTA